MGKPDKTGNQLSPEVQLFARMKLQRVVFGAFAMVLVCLFALGLSAYRKMQRETAEALATAQDAQLVATQARARASQLERQLQDRGEEVAQAKTLLALSKCRLAMAELRDGNTARAAALLDEARVLGAPPWWPLVQRLTQDTTTRFDGGASDSPIIGGTISADRSVVGVVRETGRGLVVETYSAQDGKLILSYPGVEIERTSQNCRLLLSDDGKAWYLPLGRTGYVGRGGALFVVRSENELEPSQVLSAAGAPDLKEVYEAHGAGGLIHRSHAGGGVWTTRRIVLDLQSQQVDAVCVTDDGPVVATPTGIYLVGSDGRTGLLYPLEIAPERTELRRGAGAVYVAMCTGRILTLAAIKLGEKPHIATSRHEMPDEPLEDLRFLGDDTPVWVGRSGRMFTVNFSDKREWTLGGYTLSFVERHRQGLVFGNRKGELSVRAQDELRIVGQPLSMVPPQYVPEPVAHGFTLTGPGSARFVLQGGRMRALGNVATVALAPQGAAYSDGSLHLPGGNLVAEEGVLLGAFADGSVLLFAHPQTLKQVSTQGTAAEFLLPGERVPDACVVAARANVAALRVNDAVFVSDMTSDFEQVASRLEVAPDLLALSAGGERLGVAYSATIVVHEIGGEGQWTIRTPVPPRKIALLFSGSVLVCVENGELAFYEVSSGRELMRGGGKVMDLQASGDASLNLVSGGWLYALDLTPDS